MPTNTKSTANGQAEAVEYAELGENVSYAVADGQLFVKVDLSHRHDLGNPKTIRVASTLGNKPVPGTEVVLGLNAYEYRVKK